MYEVGTLFAPREGSGGGCDPVPYRRREGGLASRQGAADVSFKRAGGAKAGVRLLLWEARREGAAKRPAGPFGPLGCGQRPLLSSDGPPDLCARCPFAAGWGVHPAPLWEGRVRPLVGAG